MLTHRLSGFTGPVPSAALDKSVFSCEDSLAFLRQIVKKKVLLFRRSAKYDKKSIALGGLAVQQLDRAGSAQTVCTEGEELLHILESRRGLQLFRSPICSTVAAHRQRDL